MSISVDTESKENLISFKLDQIAKTIRERTDSMTCYIYWLDRDREMLFLRGGDEAYKSEGNQAFYKKGDSLIWNIAERKCLVNVRNLQAIQPLEAEVSVFDGAFFAAPIIEECFARGVLEVRRESGKGIFKESELKFIKNCLEEIARFASDLESDRRINSDARFEITYKPELDLNIFYQKLSKIHDLDVLINQVLLELSGMCRAASLFKFNKVGELERTHQRWHFNPLDPIDDDVLNQEIKEEYDVNSTSFVALTLQKIRENMKLGGIRATTLHVSNVRGETDIADSDTIAPKLSRYEELIDSHYDQQEPISSALFVPIWSNHRPLGVVCLLNKLDWSDLSEDGFKKEDIKWAESMVNALSINILRIKEESKYQITQVLNTPVLGNEGLKIDYNKVCDEVVSPLTSYECCIIRKYDPGRKFVRIGISSNYDEGSILDPIRPNQETHLLTQVFRDGDSLTIPNIESESKTTFANYEWMKSKGFKSLHCQPILDKSNTFVLGTITVYTKFSFNFGENHRRNIKELSGQLSNLLEEENERSRGRSLRDFSSKLEDLEIRHVGRWSSRDTTTLIDQILRYAIWEIERYSRLDQCAVVRSSSLSLGNSDDSIELEIVKSLDRDQNNTKIRLPQELKDKTESKDGYYLFDCKEHEGKLFLNNKDNPMTYVRRLLCVPMDVLLDKDLHDGLDKTKPQEIFHYYFLFVILKEPDALAGRKRHFRPRLSDFAHESIDQYKFFTSEVTKLLKHIRRKDDSVFLDQIVDRILRSKGEIEVLEGLLDELRFKIKWVVGANIALIDTQTGMINEILGHEKSAFKSFRVTDKSITKSVCEQKKSYTWPDHKELNNDFTDCANLEARGIKKVHISPMIYEGEVLGVLYVYSTNPFALKSDTNSHTSDYMFLLDSAANKFALGLKKLEMQLANESLVSSMIHNNKNFLQYKIQGPLMRALKYEGMDQTRLKINQILSSVRKKIEKSSNEIREESLLAKPIDFRAFEAACEKFVGESDIKHDLKFMVSDLTKDNVSIPVKLSTLNMVLEDLTLNATNAYEKRENYFRVKSMNSSLKKEIHITWSSRDFAGVPFVEIVFTSRDTFISQEKITDAGFVPLKSSERGSGVGLYFLNKEFKQIGCAKYPVEGRNLKRLNLHQKRFFDIKNISDPFAGVAVSFSLPRNKISL